MRISKRSIHSAALLVLLGAATAALAQDSARQSATDQGQASMDRLEGAIARGKDDAAHLPDPRLPRTDNPTDQRRAFDGLHKRLPAPDMEARARAAQARGETSLAAERERQELRRQTSVFGLCERRRTETPAVEEAETAVPPSGHGEIWTSCE